MLPPSVVKDNVRILHNHRRKRNVNIDLDLRCILYLDNVQLHHEKLVLRWMQHKLIKFYNNILCTRGGVVGWGTMLEAGGSQFRVPMRFDFLNWPNSSRRNMSLASTQPLTEISTRNLPGGGGGGKKRPVRKAVTTLAPSRESMGVSTCHKYMSLHGLLEG
jgi:hypothetical protein